MGGLYDRPFLLPPKKPRTIVYVDGFNLYYGAVRGTPNKWLDLSKYFRLIRPHDDIILIRYFTSLVTGVTRPNQEVFLSALRTRPDIAITYGTFLSKKVKCSHTTCAHQGSRLFESKEEKRTDVNIAVHMIDDAYQDRCDRLILVSADSDLVPGVEFVRTRFRKKEVVVYVPSLNRPRMAAELRAAAHKHQNLPLNVMPRAQFPNELSDGNGKTLKKPASW